MKLYDFENDPEFNTLLYKMRANYIEWNSGFITTPFNKKEFEEGLKKGIPVTLDELEIIDGVFHIFKDGIKKAVTVYIRDQIYNNFYINSPSNYKFHLCKCNTIQKYQNQNQYQKYVANQNTDGLFKINYIQNNKVILSRNERLLVCKNCLDKIKYQDYDSKRLSFGKKEKFVKDFNLTEYFEKYGENLFESKPDYNSDTAPVNVYSDDWEKIANLKRQKVSWFCEKCGKHLANYPKFLHVHHINGRKNDNSSSNLKALCIKCHSEQSNHSHLKNLPDYIKYLEMFGDYY